MKNSFFPGAKDELMNVVQPVFFFLAAIWFWVSIRLQVLFQGET